MPLLYSNDAEYAAVYKLVVDAATEEFNRVHGGG